MYGAPLANENLQDKIENLKLFQDNNLYLLNMKINRENLTLTLSEKEKINSNSFSKKMSLNELKHIHKYFSLINSCFEFSEYLKKLSKKNQLFINKKDNENNMILTFEQEYLNDFEIVEIILLPDRINIEKKLMEACDIIEILKQKITNLENKNYELIQENNCMKNQINEIINQNINLINDMKNLNNKNNELKKENNEIKNQIFNLEINLKNEMEYKINKIDNDIKRLIKNNNLKDFKYVNILKTLKHE